MAEPSIIQTHVVAPIDTDSYNIVHHPQYLVWVEEAVLSWLLEKYGDLSACRYKITDFQCKFLTPGRLYDPLQLRLLCRSAREKQEGDLRAGMKVSIRNSRTNAVLVEGSFSLEVQTLQ